MPRRPDASARARKPQGRRPEPAPTDADGGRWGALGGLLRGSGSVIGQISGIDSPARSLERLAASAERAADHLDRLEAEVGVDRVLDILDRIETAAERLDEIAALLRRLERPTGAPTGAPPARRARR